MMLASRAASSLATARHSTCRAGAASDSARPFQPSHRLVRQHKDTFSHAQSAAPSRPAASTRRQAVLAAAAATPHQTGRIFIFGLGYVGVALGAALKRQGWHVSGTCRDEEACANFRAEGVDAHVLDADKEQMLSAEAKHGLATACHVVTTVPPNADFDQDPVLLACMPLLKQIAHSVKWVGYVSSTGVYGDYQGGWVDESSETRADGGKNGARLRAEQAWAALHRGHGLPLHIFRLGGIYGPGRSALEAVRQQDGSASQERRGRQRFTARCHVADICAVLQASMHHPNPGAVYNVVDDEPAPRSEVMVHARQLLGLPCDKANAAAESAAVASNDGSINVQPGDTPPLAEKRVLNTRIKEELGVRLAFPTYREGLAAIVARDYSPFLM